MAIALLERQAGLAQFTDEKVLSPKIQDLIARVTMDVNPAMEGQDYRPGSVVTVTFKGAKQFTHEVETPEGSPKKRLNREKLIKKYENCSKVRLPQEKIEQSREILENLNDLGNISRLFELIG